MNDVIQLKKSVAEYAVNNFIKSGMLIGLGHGSTAIFAIRKIAELIHEDQLSAITAIPCSKAVQTEAESLNIPLVEFSIETQLDVTIDGADEVDPLLNIIKGGGGALLREKIVAQASKREIIVVDYTKYSKVIGTKWAIPIEVTPFGWQAQIGFLTKLGAKVSLRTTAINEPFITDQGNFILDANFGPIPEPSQLAEAFNARAGIIEHGLFLNLATDLIIAFPDRVEHRSK